MGFVPRMLLGLLLLNLLLVALSSVFLHQSRVHYEDEARVETLNLSRLLDHDISATIRLIDLNLQATAQEAELQRASKRPDTRAFQHFVERQLFQQPNLDALRIFDATGHMVHGAGVAAAERVSIADRDYFVRLRKAPTAGLVVSNPVMGRSSPRRGILLTRAFKNPDGSFAGVVVGAMPLARFTDIFSELSVGAGGTFTLFDDDMNLVARHPPLADTDDGVGKPFGSKPLKELMRTGSHSGSYTVDSSLDGVERTFAYRKIQGVPLNISVGLAADEYLADWRREVVKTGALVMVLMFLSVAFFGLVARAWKKQSAAAAALQQANAKLDAEKHLNQIIVQESPFAIYTRDLDGRVTAWNPAAARLFGWRAEEIIGKHLLTVPPGQEAESAELRKRVLSGESIIELEVQRQKRDGTLFDLSTTLAPLRDAAGNIEGYLAIATDITARKAAERQIEFLAYRDVLTGLPNRLLLQDRFAQATAHAAREQSQVALLFLDLDNFKTINDSLGHAVGDALLREVATRLSQCVRDSDTVSRQGGDEFLIVLPELRSADDVAPVLAKIAERLPLAFAFEEYELSTSASIGIAIYPHDGKDFDTLLKKADTAMYQAKDDGRSSYRFFDQQMNAKAVEHLHLKNGLRRALARDEFELHYQPQIDLISGAVVGVEALLRWQHPQEGMMLPSRFIPVAEDSGMIVPIGEWVMREACRQAVAWQKAGLGDMTMAVNLSAVQFRRGEIEQTVMDALQESGFDPRRLELELTESILIHDTDKVLAGVRRLKSLGVKLSIDDFGTGYSSLSYLKRFDVDKLKIDQSFIRDLATDPDDAAIIRAIIQMARSLKLRTIAEGVENAATLEQLRLFECDEAQGYHFGRPMPAQDCEKFLVAARMRLSVGGRIV